MNHTLLLYFCFALILSTLVGVGCYFVERVNLKQGLITIAATVVFGLLLSTAVVKFSSASATWDYEIRNGEITSKVRLRDTYTEFYQCMCVSDSKGNQTCQTCTRAHYTVEWKALSSIYAFRLKMLDDTSDSVYLTPDPQSYKHVIIGDPVSIKSKYTNYVQAVPNSLFTPSSKSLKEKFATLIPPYPDKIYNRWKNDHVVSAGITLKDDKEWNDEVATGLRLIGPEKQVNLIFLVAKTDDSNYEYAVRDAWDNANKNDVVIVIGAKDYPKIDFVGIITWSKNELFKVELQEAIENYGVANSGLTNIAFMQIKKNFDRRHMHEFQYLENEISPPTWVLILLALLLIIGDVAIMAFLPEVIS